MQVSKILLALIGAGLFAQASVAHIQATTITNGSYKFESLEAAPSGTGQGSYNVILFAHSSGGSGNAGAGVNVDDSNRLLPTGNLSSSDSLFWLTSIGDLRAFYDLQFGGSANVNNIVLFLDVNEEGGDPNAINLETLTVYKNAKTAPNEISPVNNDIVSDDQESITGQSNGSPLKQLSNTQSLDQIGTGAGSDDWAIFTFVNPYDAAYSRSDTLLFNFKISGLDNGPETLSISGKLTSCDFDPEGCADTTSGTTGGTTGVTTAGTTAGSTGRTAGATAEIPEPESLFLLIVGLIGLSRLRGRPVDRKFPVVNRSSRGDDAYSTERGE